MGGRVLETAELLVSSTDSRKDERMRIARLGSPWAVSYQNNQMQRLAQPFDKPVNPLLIEPASAALMKETRLLLAHARACDDEPNMVTIARASNCLCSKAFVGHTVGVVDSGTQWT